MLNNAIRIGLFLLTATSAAITTAAEPLVFLGDNNTSTSAYQIARDFTPINDYVVFSANGPYGRQLYRHDGTTGSVQLVKQVGMFTDGEYGQFNFVPFGGALFFFAPDDNGHARFWKTDGTSDGTIMVSPEIYGSRSHINSPSASDPFNLFFTAQNELLHKTDGTDIGTTRVGSFTASSLASLNDVVYFSGSPDANGKELWRTDGTATGTVLVKDINPGPESSNISGLASVDGLLYFAASDSVGAGLWKSDGTEAGTIKLASLRVNSSVPFVEAGGTIYFSATTAPSGDTYQLWKTDGTAPGTQMVKDFAADGYKNPSTLTALGSKLAFVTRSTSTTILHSLWITEGSSESTTQLTSQPIREIPDMREYNGVLYYYVVSPYNGLLTPTHSEQLWATDGTHNELVTDFQVSTFSYSPKEISLVNGSLYTSIHSGPYFGSVIKINPADHSLAAISDAGAIASLTIPGVGKQIGGKTYFSGLDGLHGSEPWVTNGTPEGTHIIADLTLGAEHSWPAHFTDVNGTPYFFAFGKQLYSLWRVNSNDDGAIKIKDFPISPVVSTASVGNELYFIEWHSSRGGLWRSDGTEEGTYLVDNRVRDFTLTADGSKVYYLTRNPSDGRAWVASADPATSTVTPLAKANFYPVNNADIFTIVIMEGHAYFAGQSPYSSACLLYKTDGTPAGTSAVKLLSIGAGDIYLAPPVGDKLLFYTDPVNLGNMYISDGTESGTLPVGTYRKAYYSTADPIQAVTLGDKIVFAGNDHIYAGPWITDGTATGTRLIKEIASDINTRLYSLTFAGELVYFVTDDGAHGYELWKTDGTEAGTLMVKDINVGPGSSWPRALTYAGGTLVFSANDGVNGRELWRIDSGDIEPVRLDIAQGAISSNPHPLVRSEQPFNILDDRVVFQAYHPDYGNDLWALPLEADSSVADWNLY